MSDCQHPPAAWDGAADTSRLPAQPVRGRQRARPAGRGLTCVPNARTQPGSKGGEWGLPRQRRALPGGNCWSSAETTRSLSYWRGEANKTYLGLSATDTSSASSRHRHTWSGDFPALRCELSPCRLRRGCSPARGTGLARAAGRGLSHLAVNLWGSSAFDKGGSSPPRWVDRFTP